MAGRAGWVRGRKGGADLSPRLPRLLRSTLSDPGDGCGGRCDRIRAMQAGIVYAVAGFVLPIFIAKFVTPKRVVAPESHNDGTSD